jgi:hypothetical protein
VNVPARYGSILAYSTKFLKCCVLEIVDLALSHPWPAAHLHVSVVNPVVNDLATNDFARLVFVDFNRSHTGISLPATFCTFIVFSSAEDLLAYFIRALKEIDKIVFGFHEQ